MDSNNENLMSGFKDIKEDVVLPGFDDTEEKEDNVLPGFDDIEEKEDNILPGFDNTEEKENNVLPGFDDIEEKEDNVLPGFDDIGKKENIILPGFETKQRYKDNTQQSNFLDKTQNQYYQTNNISNLLTKDKKMVSFVGTSKNGISFIVNNLAVMLAKIGINVAILDMTQNKNSYYIYTQNDENLRKKTYECMQNLEKGIANGIDVNKNISVYTSLPDENLTQIDVVSVMETIIKKHDLVLIDCDFNSPDECFSQVQEIYLVQSMDILTIQPLTAFLKELKAKNILQEEKIKIIINKDMKVRGLTPKVLIGGMSSYNDPAMSFMTELFNKDTVQYCTIPFEVPTYSRYLEGLVNCEVSLNGYSKMFLNSLKTLAGMVYPLINNKYMKRNDYSKNNKFSSEMNSTLNQMKNRY